MTVTVVHRHERLTTGPLPTARIDVTLTGVSRHHAPEIVHTVRQLIRRLDQGPQRGASTAYQIAVSGDDAGPDGICIDPATRSVTRAGVPVALTRIEFDLLFFLAENARRVFSRVQLLDAVWGYRYTGERTVDVHITRLRAKLGVPALVTTVRGIGYRLHDDAIVRIEGA